MNAQVAVGAGELARVEAGLEALGWWCSPGIGAWRTPARTATPRDQPPLRRSWCSKESLICWLLRAEKAAFSSIQAAFAPSFSHAPGRLWIAKGRPIQARADPPSGGGRHRRSGQVRTRRAWRTTGGGTPGQPDMKPTGSDPGGWTSAKASPGAPPPRGSARTGPTMQPILLPVLVLVALIGGRLLGIRLGFWRALLVAWLGLATAGIFLTALTEQARPPLVLVIALGLLAMMAWAGIFSTNFSVWRPRTGPAPPAGSVRSGWGRRARRS